ncbi:MAG: phosphate ABC transporter permease PstA [Eggerthellaceae bacterium]|jgi:phosphate transport system permease protein|nr:phosphate ABC transporter permease PstA [Eggerthellaceae bacterium]CCY06055.1 phosphate ABC transporter permease protein PstA [Eggerthella sp. CAG:1427]
MADNRVLTKAKPAKLSSWIFRYAVKIATVITVLAVCLIIGYILIMGVPQIKPEMFELEYNSDNVSFMPALFNTLIVIVMAVSCSSIFGIGAAIFLNEYTNKTNFFVRIVALATETLSGIPSIVYGLFGLLFFVYYLQWGLSLLAGVCTMAIMTFPIIMRASQEALAAVPDLYREGSFGLGAGRFRTVFKIVLPAAIPGILGGIILAIGRTVGESAALIYTAGSIAAVPETVFSSTRTLAVHMYLLASEGLHIDATYATAVLLLLFVLLINFATSAVANRISKGNMSDE